MSCISTVHVAAGPEFGCTNERWRASVKAAGSHICDLTASICCENSRFEQRLLLCLRVTQLRLGPLRPSARDHLVWPAGPFRRNHERKFNLGLSERGAGLDSRNINRIYTWSERCHLYRCIIGSVDPTGKCSSDSFLVATSGTAAKNMFSSEELPVSGTGCCPTIENHPALAGRFLQSCSKCNYVAGLY